MNMPLCFQSTHTVESTRLIKFPQEAIPFVPLVSKFVLACFQPIWYCCATIAIYLLNIFHFFLKFFFLLFVTLLLRAPIYWQFENTPCSGMMVFYHVSAFPMLGRVSAPTPRKAKRLGDAPTSAPSSIEQLHNVGS